MRGFGDDPTRLPSGPRRAGYRRGKDAGTLRTGRPARRAVRDLAERGIRWYC